MVTATGPTRQTQNASSSLPSCWPAAGMLCGVAATYSIFLLDGGAIEQLTREDGLVETLGALGFLAASLLFLMAYVYSSGRRRNLFYLALSLLFMFGFLEEISWGQRLLNIETPELLAEGNLQHELNIHNLEVFEGNDAEGNRKSFWGLLLNMDRLFSLFWFSLCVCIPLACRYAPKARTILQKLRVPIVSTVFAIPFVANYLIARAAVARLGQWRHNVVEHKESVFALLFLCVAAWLLHHEVKSKAAMQMNNTGSSPLEDPCSRQDGT